MARPATLDPDLLRSFLAIAEERSFTRAAACVGRTQSAVSMQLQRLETVLGQQLIHRGRGGAVELTRHGTYLLDRAREMLAVNDDIWRTFHEPDITGAVRFGTPDDYILRFLPDVLMRFAEAHPQVEVEVTCAPSAELSPLLQQGLLDLAIISGGLEPPGLPAELLLTDRLIWVGSERYATHRRDPIPLALAKDECNCTWRRAATESLSAAGLRYRIAYSSASQAGTLAPVLAGLAITVAAAHELPRGLVQLGAADGLPDLPEYRVLMVKGRDAHEPVTDALGAYMAEVFSREARRAPLPAV